MGLGVIFVFVAATMVVESAWEQREERRQTAQDTKILASFRETYKIPAEQPVAGRRWTGQTVYFFQVEGRNILYAAGQWVELNPAKP